VRLAAKLVIGAEHKGRIMDINAYRLTHLRKCIASLDALAIARDESLECLDFLRRRLDAGKNAPG
jgi:hypothetical protein